MALESCIMLNYFLCPLQRHKEQLMWTQLHSLTCFMAFQYSQPCFPVQKSVACVKGSHFSKMHVAEPGRLNPWCNCSSLAAVKRRDGVYTEKTRSCAKKECFAFPACPDGFFGIDCHQVCKCKNAAGCDHVLGSCHCLPGWLGESCEQRTYLCQTPNPKPALGMGNALTGHTFIQNTFLPKDARKGNHFWWLCKTISSF